MSSLGNKEIMAQNIRFYMERDKKTRADVCRDLDIAYTTFTDWVNGNAYPRIDKIESMAHYFGITKADLVEERPTPESESGPISPDDAHIMDLLRQLTPENKKKFAEKLEVLVEFQSPPSDNQE